MVLGAVELAAVVVSEDMNLDCTTHISHLATACNSSSVESDFLTFKHLHTVVHTVMWTQIITIHNNKIFLKITEQSE